MLNEGYLLALKRLSSNSGNRTLEYAQRYALEKKSTIPEALLFGSRGCAYYSLVNFIIEEKIHGMHRPGRKPHQLWTEETKAIWLNANNSCNIPQMLTDGKGREFDYQVDSAQKYLPQGIVSKIGSVWRQNPALMYYVGANR